jgi:hypothetical protein
MIFDLDSDLMVMKTPIEHEELLVVNSEMLLEILLEPLK